MRGRREWFTPKRYHLAAKFRADGGVSALCFNPPRKIDISRACWTIRKEAVTCKACLALLAENATEAP